MDDEERLTHPKEVLKRFQESWLPDEEKKNNPDQDEKGDPDLDVPASEWLKRANPELLGYSIFDAEQTRRMMGILPKEQQSIHVAVLQPDHGGSGPAKLLGAYTQRVRAEGRCWRELQALGYYQPTDVVEFIIDKDYDLDAADSAEAAKLWDSVPMPSSTKEE